MRTALVLVLSLQLTGCAAVFRGTQDTVSIASTPTGAEATIRVKRGERSVGATPTRATVDRQGSTPITLAKDGFDEHHGAIKKSINGAWLTLDVVTCLPLLCVPLLVDALTGAWYDVKPYVASLQPSDPSAAPAAPAKSDKAAFAGREASGSSPSAPAQMSESERKATARAAFVEGVTLQDQGRCGEALERLEAAQKLYFAPTHLVHIGQCQAATGNLVEAAETFETLVRTPLTAEAPEAFRAAQDDGKKQLAQLRPRIPTLRIRTIPASSKLSSVVVKLNGKSIPSEVLGIARPVNPGRFHVTVWAAGYKEATADVEVREGSTQALDMKLTK